MRRASGRNRRRPRLQSCVLCCALTATGLLALVHVAALRAMHEKPAVQAPYVLAAGETEVHVAAAGRTGVASGYAEEPDAAG